MQLVHHNVQQLKQLSAILQQLSPQQYSRVAALPHEPTVGRHTRHLLEHYQQLFNGMQTGRVSYASRQREESLEQHPKLALIKLDDIQQRLQRITSPYSFPMLYESEDSRLASNLARELDFLHSHTIHHMAVINIILYQADIHIEHTADLHPSTVEYMRTCAP